MKKILFICITVVFSIAGFSQNVEPEYFLSEIHSADELEYEKYTYNSDMLLKATDIISDDGTKLKDTLSYDQSNNIIKLDNYDLLNGNWTYVAYIDYTYDESGNRVSRSNYNSFGSSTFALGGTYDYYYENNKLTNWELYMDGTDLIGTGTISYNSNGQIIEELAKDIDIWNSGPLENSWKIDYEYNSDGTLKTTAQSFWNGSSWYLSGSSEWFYYDDNKNCIKWEQKSDNRITNMNLYEYNMEFTVDQLIFPVNPEDESYNESLVEMNNMVTLKHWYSENNAGDLVHVTDYIYAYEPIDVLGVPNHGFSADNMLIYPNPTSDLITITSDKTNITKIDVLDNIGRVVLKESNLNIKKSNLDVSGLNSGVYYVRLYTSKGIATKKLVVQ